MRETYNYNSMPLFLAAAAIGFVLATFGTATASGAWADRGVMIAALATPLALAYLHFIVLTDAPWWATWGGFVLGGAGSGLLLASPASPFAMSLGGVGYMLIGIGFIASPSKPTPPGVFFAIGGTLIVLNAWVIPNTWVLTTGYAALAFTFGFGAIASARQAITGQPAS